MPSTYDVLGLIIGVISLLAFAKYVNRLIQCVQPPARVRDVENTITEIRKLVGRLENLSNFVVGTRGTWADDHRQLAEFSLEVDLLWLEVTRWEARGIARFSQPAGSPEFIQLHSTLRRKVDHCYARLIRQHMGYVLGMVRLSSSDATSSPGHAVSGSDGARPYQEALEQQASRTRETHSSSQMGAPRTHVEAATPAGGILPSDTVTRPASQKQPSVDTSITTPDLTKEGEEGNTSSEVGWSMEEAECQNLSEELKWLRERGLYPLRGGGRERPKTFSWASGVTRRLPSFF